MPIDTHVRVAAWLHIALAVLGLSVLAMVGLFFGAFGVFGAHYGGADSGVLGWIGSLGAVFVVLIALWPAAELLGGILLLRGSAAGRVLTILFSVLDLVNFPIGTAVGIYSLWALLRTPEQPPAALPMA